MATNSEKDIGVTEGVPVPIAFREDLLGRVAEVWEGAGYRVLRQKNGCEAIWLRREPGRVAYALTLTWDTADAGAIILLLDEMEKRGYDCSLDNLGFTPSDKYRCIVRHADERLPEHGEGATRGEAVVRAFVQVMEAVKE